MFGVKIVNVEIVEVKNDLYKNYKVGQRFMAVADLEEVEEMKLLGNYDICCQPYGLILNESAELEDIKLNVKCGNIMPLILAYNIHWLDINDVVVREVE